MDNTAQQPTPPVTPPHHFHILPLFLVGLIMLGAGLGGGYFLASKQSTPNQTANNTQEIPTVTPTAKPTIPTTANQKISPPAEIKSEITTPQIKSIPITSTTGWKTISFKGVSFKIPPDLTFKDLQDSSNTAIIYLEGEIGGPRLSVAVQDYKGGSRRKEYFGNNYYDCHYIYEDALFGKVKALQIAADVNWCQGGYTGAIVTVVGDKLVAVPGLGYDLETKEISRYQFMDTFVSTISN